MRIVIRALPSFGAYAWLMWYCVEARWNEVVAPNLGWLLLGTGIASGTVWWLTRKKGNKVLVVRNREVDVVTQERLVAREVCTMRTVIRERSIYRS